MSATHQRLAGLAAFTALALACNPDKGPVEPIAPTFDRLSETSSAPLVQHIVAPQATDPAIDQALDDHYAWLDTTAQWNHKLFVFLPGGRQRPGMFQLVPKEAARLGYHVIGLMYPNSVQLGAVCLSVPDPNACYEDARLEIVDGVDRSDVVDVNQANSIDNRLTKLLAFLAAQYPAEGWARFLADDKPKWSQIAISGHSQGGGQAAIIAKLHVVDRVVLFSSVVDRVGTQAAHWVATHVTPAERYWGLAHERDGNFPAIRASWDSIGMAAFGPAFVAPETTEPPYSFTHMLVTEVVPLGGFVGTNAHGAPSNDLNTPLGPDGTPMLRDAWRYLLTARSAGHEDPEANKTSTGGER